MSEPIRVLLLSHLYPRPDRPSYGTFVARRTEALRAHVGIKVVAPVRCVPMTRSSLRREGAFERTFPEGSVGGIEVLRPRYLSFPRPPLWSWNGDLMYLGIRRTVRALYDQWPFQVLHAHTVYPDGYAACRVMRSFRRDHPQVRLVIGVGGSDIYIQPKRGTSHRRKILWALGETDAVLGVSRALCREVRGMVPGVRCTPVPNGVDGDQFEPTDHLGSELSRLRLDLGIGGGSVVLFVGNLIFSKGIRELLEAFRTVVRARPEAFLVLVGRTVELGYVRATAKDFGIEDRLRIVGTVNPEEIPTWMHLADLFVLPSHTEGMPNVVIEAMAAGKPVIAADVGGVNEVVRDGATGILVPPREPGPLAEAMIELLSDGVRSVEMGSRGLERVRASFTLKQTAASIARVYRDVVGEN